MSFNAYCRLEARLRPDTTPREVEEACRPFLDWRGDSLKPNDADLYETGVAFDPFDAQFILQVTSSCPNSFADEIFTPLVNAIGALAAEPFEAVLINESSSSDDERLFRLVAGPADQVNEFRSKAATRGVCEWLAEVSLPPGSSGLGLDAAALQGSGFSISLPVTGAGIPRPSISLNLAGLELSDRESDEVGRLAVVLARVLGKHAPLAIHALGNPDETEEPTADDAPRG